MKKNTSLQQLEILRERRIMENSLAASDESAFRVMTGFVVKSALVALAVYLLFGSAVDWSSWKTYAAIAILSKVL